MTAYAIFFSFCVGFMVGYQLRRKGEAKAAKPRKKTRKTLDLEGKNE